MRAVTNRLKARNQRKENNAVLFCYSCCCVAKITDFPDNVDKIEDSKLNAHYARIQGVGAGVVRSRRFSGGVGFLTTLGVGFFCPTPDVQLDHFYITLLNWKFLLK